MTGRRATLVGDWASTRLKSRGPCVSQTQSVELSCIYALPTNELGRAAAVMTAIDGDGNGGGVGVCWKRDEDVLAEGGSWTVRINVSAGGAIGRRAVASSEAKRLSRCWLARKRGPI